MKKLTNFLQQDISLRKRRPPKKLKTSRQRKVIQLFNNLLESGFTLTEIVDFLDRSSLLAPAYTKEMRASLLAGENLAAMMGKLGFSDDVVTQLSLAELHGNTQGSLLKIEAYLAHLMTVKRKLWEVATYPIILLTFLILIMLGLRNYLLPQLERTNLATRIINHFPLVFLIGVLVLALVILCLIWLQRRSRKITWYSRLARLPLLGRFVQLYLTAYYAREWGNLIGQGVEMSRIVQLMQEQRSQLFQEIGREMEAALLAGQEFHHKVLDYPFFLRELSLIIEYGQVKSKLGSELEVYAQEAWEAFFSRVNRATQLIQPLVFILVALVIVMIYAAMLLPMYHNMEVPL
ncbi:competence type IV pilus assembly protein ComGB [Streptococcus sobrinus]|uniref:competence type IV pilus assembly protein ComGB n=2 Tax=Streptococcus sobrinus TaxID=1310 RepID=UPI0020D216A2|nr:competence type IV pilus assembly protein ComGB [Streptococcus sobrinus]